MEYSVSHTNQRLDVGGSHRYLFFTSTGARRTKAGRQVLSTRRSVAVSGDNSRTRHRHHSSRNRSDSSTASASSAAGWTNSAGIRQQHSSTQTDMRDSEIQTDPWWHRSEGSLKDLGLPLLCCRGSHRKLERALWMARSRAEAMMTNADEEDDDSPFDPQQRTVGCGPSYCEQGSGRAYLPDPLDLWVSTYTKLRIDDVAQQEKMATMKRRLLERQQRRYSNLHHHHQLSHRQGFSSSTASSSSSSDQSSLISHYVIDTNNERHVSAAVRRLDADIVSKALDSLCRKLDSSRI